MSLPEEHIPLRFWFVLAVVVVFIIAMLWRRW